MRHARQNISVSNTRFARLATALTCVFMLVAISLLHQPVFATKGYSPVELAQYQLPDGSLPELCINGSLGGDHSGGQPHCPLCTLAKVFDLPQSNDVLIPVRYAKFSLYVAKYAHFIEDNSSPNIGPRGPPSLA